MPSELLTSSSSLFYAPHSYMCGHLCYWKHQWSIRAREDSITSTVIAGVWVSTAPIVEIAGYLILQSIFGLGNQMLQMLVQIFIGSNFQPLSLMGSVIWLWSLCMIYIWLLNRETSNPINLSPSLHLKIQGLFSTVNSFFRIILKVIYPSPNNVNIAYYLCDYPFVLPDLNYIMFSPLKMSCTTKLLNQGSTESQR